MQPEAGMVDVTLESSSSTQSGKRLLREALSHGGESPSHVAEVPAEDVTLELTTAPFATGSPAHKAAAQRSRSFSPSAFLDLPSIVRLCLDAVPDREVPRKAKGFVMSGLYNSGLRLRHMEPNDADAFLMLQRELCDPDRLCDVVFGLFEESSASSVRVLNFFERWVTRWEGMESLRNYPSALARIRAFCAKGVQSMVAAENAAAVHLLQAMDKAAIGRGCVQGGRCRRLSVRRSSSFPPFIDLVRVDQQHQEHVYSLLFANKHVKRSLQRWHGPPTPVGADHSDDAEAVKPADRKVRARSTSQSDQTDPKFTLRRRETTHEEKIRSTVLPLSLDVAQLVCEYPARAVAHQLTLMVRPRELWTSQRRKSRLGSGSAGRSGTAVMMALFELYSLWPASVLSEEDLTKEFRLSMVEFFLDVVDECKLQHDYHTTFALLSGLSFPGIQFIFSTSFGGPHSKGMNARYQRLRRIMNTRGDYRVYRASLSKCLRQARIPFLGFLTRKLTLYETEVRPYLKGDKTQINFKRCQMSLEAVCTFLSGQAWPHDDPHCPDRLVHDEELQLRVAKILRRTRGKQEIEDSAKSARESMRGAGNHKSLARRSIRRILSRRSVK